MRSPDRKGSRLRFPPYPWTFLPHFPLHSCKVSDKTPTKEAWPGHHRAPRSHHNKSPNMKKITGIHHITAVSGDVQENIDFYTGFLALRLVKQTVNFDNRNGYHFYFGDAKGTPGTIFTTFPLGKDMARGRQGKGMGNTTAFSLALEGLDFWSERLQAFDIPHQRPQERFKGELAIHLEDPDGIPLELVFTENDPRQGHGGEIVPDPYAIKGFHHVEIWVESQPAMAQLLTREMDHYPIGESGNRFRYGVEDLPGKYIDILWVPHAQKSLPGRGTVHHIAFETPNAETQAAMLERLEILGYRHSGLRDRKYFQSIYFRETNGVLFEIATSGPGFSVDEEYNSLGGAVAAPRTI